MAVLFKNVKSIYPKPLASSWDQLRELRNFFIEQWQDNHEQECHCNHKHEYRQDRAECSRNTARRHSIHDGIKYVGQNARREKRRKDW